MGIGRAVALKIYLWELAKLEANANKELDFMAASAILRDAVKQYNDHPMVADWLAAIGRDVHTRQRINANAKSVVAARYEHSSEDLRKLYQDYYDSSLPGGDDDDDDDDLDQVDLTVLDRPEAPNALPQSLIDFLKTVPDEVTEIWILTRVRGHVVGDRLPEKVAFAANAGEALQKLHGLAGYSEADARQVVEDWERETGEVVDDHAALCRALEKETGDPFTFMVYEVDTPISDDVLTILKRGDSAA